ncbi:hypothetical protein CHS0354_029701 [Potamilus streckersoni]|uniref:Serine/threonine-protein phosphatase 4 regulatory subunit 2 n=1 Tax=Potamilus streckersoni TaxID=2493646 RepID=A0AAE0RTR5_9BIVA|nr:hypothetical protein CHS0354_029701 [Potamilus streckersoni]
MENREDVLDALTNFEKKPSGEIPELLEEYLRQVAKSGETIYPWHRLKRLFVSKLDHIIMEFYHETPADSIPTYPNVDSVPFEDMRKRILDALEKFHGAPFTVQRICELITDPRRHYKRSDKFLRGIEKNVMVVSTVDPFGRKIVSEPPKVMVNGLDVNGHENEKSSKKRTEESLPLVCESENSPSWTPDYGAISVWPRTNSPVKQLNAKSQTGEDAIKVSPTNSSHSSLEDHQSPNRNAKLSDGDVAKTDNEWGSKKTEPEYEHKESVPGKEKVNEQGGSQKDTTESDERVNTPSKSLGQEESSLETSSSSDDGKDIIVARTDSIDDQKQDNLVPDKQSDNESTQINCESDSDSSVRPEEQKSTPQSSDDESSGDGQPRQKKAQWVSSPSELKPDVPDNLSEGDAQQTCVALEENKNQSGVLHDLPDSSSSQTCSLSQEASEETENQSLLLRENNEQAEEIDSTITNAAAEMMDMDNCENVDSDTPMDNSADDAEHQATNLDNTGADLTENQSSDEPMEQE